MKQLLLICAVVMGQSVLAADEVLITDSFLKEAIGTKLGKPYGKFAPPMKLTKAEVKKIRDLDLRRFFGAKITDEGLKEVAKLQQLERLNLHDTKITAAGVAELQKALPECLILSNPTK